MSSPEESRISVLHVLFHSLPYSCVGYDIRSHYILKSQRILGIDAYGLTGLNDSSQMKKDMIDDVTYYRTPNPKLLIWPIVNMPNTGGGLLLGHFLKRRLHELINILQPKVIHAHTPWLVGRPAMEVARQRGIPFVYEVRGVLEESRAAEDDYDSNSKKYRKIRLNEEHIMKGANSVVVISEGLKHEIMSRGLVKEENIHIVPNGVDLTRFKPIPKDYTLINKFGLSEKVVIGYISSLRKMEGISYLIEAMQFVDKKASLIIVGDGPERERLEDRVKDLKLSDRVILTGRVPHEDVLSYYSIIDIFVIPRINARVCHIVTPLKPLEAMAMGICVLASRVGGLSEMIIDGQTGVMFESENVKDLSEKLNDLVENETFRNQLAENALRYVKEERDWKIICNRYLDVYAQ